MSSDLQVEQELEAARISLGDGIGDILTLEDPADEICANGRFSLGEALRVRLSETLLRSSGSPDEPPQEGAAEAAAAAVRRANHLRERHARTPPLAPDAKYTAAAAVLAAELAEREASEGLSGLLKVNAESYALELPDDDWLFGLTISRMPFSDFRDLPVQSVDSWYSARPTADVKALSHLDQASYRHYIQLIDGSSCRMGWAAAKVGAGAAYAVALYDHAIVEDEAAIGRLLPADADS